MFFLGLMIEYENIILYFSRQEESLIYDIAKE